MAGNRDLSKFANQLFVSSNGNIGLATNVNLAIGHTNPTSKLDILGHVNIDGNLKASGVSTFSTLNVSGGTIVSTSASFSNLTISGVSTFNTANFVGLSATTLSVSGFSTFNTGNFTDLSSNNLNISGVSTVNRGNFTNLSSNNLNISGVSTVNRGNFVGLSATTLNVSGVSTFKSIISDDINVSGISTFNNANFTGLSATTISATNLSVSGFSTFNNGRFVGLSATTLNVSDVSTFKSIISDDVSVSGFSTFNNGRFVGLSATTLNVSGVSTFGSLVATAASFVDTNVSGTLTAANINSTSLTAGSASVGGLTVSGEATFQNNVNFNGTVVYTGVTSLSGTSTIDNLSVINANVSGILTATNINVIDTLTSASVASTVGEIENLIANNLEITGISTFSGSVFFEEDIEVTGVSTFVGNVNASNIDLSGSLDANTVIANQATVDEIDTNILNVDRYSISYSGTLSGISTNIITGTATTGISVGYLVTGTNIPQGTTVLSIGSSSITLNQNATNAGEITIIFTYTDLTSGVADVYSITGGVVGFTSGSIGILTGTSLSYTTAVLNNYQASIGTVTSLDTTDLSSNVGIISDISGINLNYSGVGTISALNVSTLNAGTVDIESVDITSLTGQNFSFAGIGTVSQLNSTSGTIGILTATNLAATNVSVSNSITSLTINSQILDADKLVADTSIVGASTITTATISDLLVTEAFEVSGSLVAVGGTISDLEGTSITYSSGDIDSLESQLINVSNKLTSVRGNIGILTGIDLDYSGIATLSNINSNIATIDFLDGTSISYSGVGTFGSVNITNGITIGSNLTAAGATFTNNVDAFSITTEDGTIDTLNGIELSYNSGIITSLSGTNINYSGIGTIPTLQGVDISYTGVGTFGQVGITTATIGTVSATNVSILGNLSVSNLTVGVITATTGIIDNITSTEATITNLDGTNLNYSGIGTIQNISSTKITTTNLASVDINSTGISTLPTVKSTNITNTEDIRTDYIYSRVGIITDLSGNTIDYNSGSVDNLSGVNLNYSGIGTIPTINSTTIVTTDISGTNSNFTGISTFNKVGVTSLTSQSIFGSAGIITALSGETLNFSQSADISNVTIGLGNTELIVVGDARITGILTVGNSSVTINGINNSISGVSTITANVGNISTITGIDAIYTDVELEGLTFSGINTSNNFNTKVNIVSSNSGVSTSYNLILPAQLGIPGTVLTLESDGNLGFTTAGLYENRIYVSPVNGDDSNDGKARPVKTIKKAAQLASFESFILPGGRYLDAANLLTANKAFIAAEVVGFVTNTYPGITTSADYDEATCKRDIGYIIDAISYDLSYGGNSKSVEAGLAYWNAGTSYVDGESVETIAGYNYIVGISSYIINNVSVPTSYQGIQTAFQSFDLTLAYDDDCNPSAYSQNCCADVRSAIGNYIGIVTSIIGIGTTAAPTVTLPTSKSTPVAVIVEAGEYVEDNPIILYEDVAIIGDNLRNTIIRPANAGKDLFRVRNGCYLTGFALKDAVDPAGVPQFTFDYAVAFDDPSDPTTSRAGYAVKTTKPIITRSPYIQNCSILSFLGANGILVDGSKVDTLNTAIIPEESENPVEGAQPEFGKSMVAAAFTMVSFGGIGWRVINDGYSQVVSCFQIFCRYGSLAQSGGYLSITNSATNFGLYALRSTGYNARSYIFDRGLVASTGTSGGLQTLKVIGLGRADQELYVVRFINKATGLDETPNFKLAPITKEIDISVGVNTVTNTIGIQTHGFTNGDSVIYLGNEATIPAQVIGGLVNLNEYYVQYINDNEFKLYEDDSLTRLVDLTSATSGINTFIKGNQEFFNSEMMSSHTSYQRISLASTTSTLNFVPGRQLTQTVNGGTATGIAYTYNSSTKELIVSVEAPGGVRNNFGVTGVGVNGLIQDHSGTPVSIGVTAVVGITTLHTVEFKVSSTQVGSQILGIGGLPENYRVHFHRPSIVNSSSHTWEFSGSGTDYNALPQNGGKTRVETEQVFSQGGRVYSSGTNELGDFKIGNFITAYNRTGNIIFNNKVSIGQLDSLRLSLSGGIAIEEFSTDVGLGDNEIGGAQHSRVSTQKAVRSFLNNRLGNFIDKDLSTNAVPSAVVQLNAFGQINADLIPPKVVNYYSSNVGGGRTTLVDRIPAVDIRQGDTVVEPEFSYVLISDVYSQYLVLSDSNRNYDFVNGDQVVSAVSNGGAIGIVTAPTTVGYGTTGLVKGVLLNVGITTGGTGYTNPGIYTSVSLSSVTGVGTGAKANVTVGASGTVTNVTIVYGGRYYDETNILTISNANDIGGRSGGSDFQVSVQNIETRLYLELTNNQKFTGSTLLNDYIEDGTAVGISTTLTTNYIVNFDPTSVDTGGDIDFINDRIVVGVNSFSDGDNIIYSAEGGNVLEDLISGDTYYVKRVGISSIELYTTYALSNKKNLLSSGTGTHSLTRKTINVNENKITILNHGYSTGDAVRASGNTPGGITAGSYYFVGSATTNGFTLHDTQQTALSSVNGLIFNPIDITSVGTGTFTLTKQNVQYTKTVNTSSSIVDNWTVLSSGTVDAANITTGTVSPSRLGSGTANSDTFLGGDSVYRKAVKSVGIGTTTPMTITSSSFEVNGGITKHFGDLQVTLNRVEETLETYSTVGVAKFKTSTFDVGDDGAVSIRNSQTGDVDAATLGGFTGAYYLDLNNSTGTVPIPRGGTGLSALPSDGYILVGNGSAYTLTGDPTIAGTLTGEITIKSGGDIELPTGTWTGDKAAKIQNSSNNLYLQYTTNLIGRNSQGTDRLTLTSGGDLTIVGAITGTRLTSNVANGTAPLTVTSSTLVSNLNADLIDGIDGASLLRSDANDDFSGTLTYTGTGTALNFTSTGEVILADHSSNSTPVPFDIRKSGSSLTDSSDYGILHLSRLNHNNSSTSAGASLYFQLRDSGGTLREYAGISGQKTEAGAAGGRLQFFRYGRTSLGYWDSTGLYVGTDKVWTAGNDGSGTGLDADLLDGLDSSAFLRSNTTDTIESGSILQFATSAGNVRGYIQSTDTDDSHLIIATSGGEDIAFKDGGVGGTTNFIIRGDGTLIQGTSNTIWHAGNDGPGSGLDADTVDGLQASQFLRSDANTSTTGYLGAEGFVGTGGGALRLSLPHGASYATSASTVTGAIKVTLPQSWSDTMLRMTIKVYEYATGESFEVVCCGYNYTGNSSWLNTSAYIINDTQVNRNFNIRFGHDDTRCCIYIGETNSTWSYPQVAVTEFEAGYSNYSEETWNDGWAIGFESSAFGAITSTLSNRQVGKYVDGSLVWTAGNDGSGSTLDADTVDGVQADSFIRSDANDSVTGVIDFLGGSSTTPAIRIKSGGSNWSEGLAIHPSADNGYALAFFRPSATLTTNTNTWAIGNLGENGTNNFGLIRNGLTGSAGIRADAIFDATQGGTLRFGFTPTVGSNTMWHAGNDGSGSTLDADLLDGYHVGTSGNTIPVLSGNNTWSGTNLFTGDIGNSPSGSANGVWIGKSSGNDGQIQLVGPSCHIDFANGTEDFDIRIIRTGDDSLDIQGLSASGLLKDNNVIWHAGNDGPSSGLDADTLDTFTWDSSGKNVRATEFYADNWFRNYNSGEGLYNEATAMHWYSDANWRFRLYSTSTASSILFTTNGDTARGYVYADTASSIGFLNAAGDWGLRYLSTDGNSPNLYFLESANENWTGNPGNDEGKIEYHSNRFYIASGANSTEIARFRQSGTDRVIIQNDGNITINSNTVWHAGNDGPGSGLDADTLDTLQLHSGRNNEANKVVRTDENGYIQAGWINSVSGNMGDWGNGVNKYYLSNDDYIRYIDRNSIKVQLGLTAKYDADRRDFTTDSNYFVGSMGWGTTDMNDVMTWGSGFIDSWGNPGNQPSGTSHWVGVQAYHYVNAANSGYGWQMVGGPIGNLRFRNSWPNNSSWKTIPILDVNDTNGGGMYAGIYYDASDTNYYLDPASNGTRSGFLNGNLWINPKSESYGEGITFNMPSQNTWGGIRWYRNGAGAGFAGNWAFGYFGNESNNDIGFHNGSNGWRLDHSFNMTSTGSVRSPIFYDSNDTAFYIDAASTSFLASIGFGGRQAWNTASTSQNGTLNLGYLLSSTGYQLFWDEDFANGSNGISVYNNAGGSALTNARIGDATAPNSSRVILRFTYNGGSNGTSPGYGGFYFALGTSANRSTICRFKAKLKTGASFVFVSNAMGSNNNNYWITSNSGTGKWEEYAYIVMAGDSGSFSSTHFYYVTGSFSNGETLFDLASATVYDISNNFDFQKNRLYAQNDIRTPIFYDLDNTGYYANLADTGTSINIAGSLRAATNNKPAILSVANGSASTGASIAIQQETSEGWTAIFADFEPNTGWGFYHDNPSNYFSFTAETATGSIRSFTVPSRSSGNRTAHEKFRIDQNNGDFITGRDGYANSSFRSPIFYDNNDTNYYVDPRSASRLSGLRLDGVDNDASGNDAILWINKPNNNDWAMIVTGALEYGIDLRMAASHSYAIRCLADNSEYSRLGTDLFYHNSNIRAPIFYDNNNTNYYIDAASTSVLNSLDVNGSLNAYANPITVNRINFRTTSGGASSDPYCLRFVENASNNCWLELQLNDDADEEFRIYGNSCNGSGCGEISGNLYHRFRSDGWAWHADYVQGGNSIRGPIFYDSNDTGYYLDPNSTSDSALRIRGGALHGPNPTWGAYLLVGGDGRQNYINSTTASVCTTNGNLHLDAGSGYDTYINYYDGSNVYFGNGGNSSVAQIASDGTFRSPVFYDYNNTGYYVDPASSSFIRGQLGVQGGHGNTQIRLTANGAELGSGQTSAMTWWISEPGITWNEGGFGYNVTNDNGSPNGFGRLNTNYGQAYMRFSTAGHLYFYNTNTSGTRYTNMELYSDNTVYINNYATGGNSLRAPIFYDSNDTGYYADPNSTSRFNVLTPNLIDSPYEGGNSGLVRSSYPYSFGFQENGGWSYPYPDLVLQYHTGVTFAANASYDGMTFKADYADDTVIFRVNGGSNYLYKYYWMYTNTTGFYSDTNSAHIYPNTGSSYGTWRIDGSRGGYAGFWFNNGGGVAEMFDSSGNGGWYREGSGLWYAYYNLANTCMGIDTSTTSSSYGLYVNGSIFSTANIVSASDARLKDNVVTIESALDKVMNLRGVTFTWNNKKEGDQDYGKTQMGFIAQEVEPIVPEVVTYAEDIDEYSLNYGQLTALLTEAIKEQQDLINSMRKEIEELKKKIGE